MLKAKDIMKHGVLTVTRETPVYKAISVLVGRRMSSLPVVDDKMGLVGVISEKDVLKQLYEFKEGNVEEFMTEDVVSFDQEDSLAEICECFIDNHFRRIAILNKGKVVSVISRSDIIEANKDKFEPQGWDEESTVRRDVFRAKDVMTYGLFTVKSETPICEAVELLLKEDVTGLPVVDEQMNLKGIITEKDILKVLYNSDAKAEAVEDLMTDEVFCFGIDSSLFEICECHIEHSFRRVMILDGGRLAGIISRTDIIAFILRNRSAILKCKCAV